MVVPPFPYCIEEDRHNVPLEDCWYARPQLFFTCVMRLKHGRLPKDKRGHTGPDDIVYTLVFFSTFEELNLPLTAISTKATRGCGSLGAASPALGACPSSRLGRGRMPQAMHGISGQPRQNGLARRLKPDSK